MQRGFRTLHKHRGSKPEGLDSSSMDSIGERGKKKYRKKQLPALWFGCLPGHDGTPEESPGLFIPIRVSVLDHTMLRCVIRSLTIKTAMRRNLK